MKHILVSVFLLVILSSCSVSDEHIDYPLIPNGTVTTCYNDIVFSAMISYADNGKMYIEMTQPTELKGIIFIFNGESVSVSKDDVSLEYDQIFIETVPMLLINTVIESVNSLKPEFTPVGDDLSFSAKNNEIDYEIRLDPQGERIKSIQVNKYLFEFK